MSWWPAKRTPTGLWGPYCSKMTVLKHPLPPDPHGNEETAPWDPESQGRKITTTALRFATMNDAVPVAETPWEKSTSIKISEFSIRLTRVVGIDRRRRGNRLNAPLRRKISWRITYPHLFRATPWTSKTNVPNVEIDILNEPSLNMPDTTIHQFPTTCYNQKAERPFETFRD